VFFTVNKFLFYEPRLTQILPSCQLTHIQPTNIFYADPLPFRNRVITENAAIVKISISQVEAYYLRFIVDRFDVGVFCNRGQVL
jgi:hypothetical protein